MSEARNKNTIREAMVAHALEEIDAIVDRLDDANAQSKEMIESIPSHFEDVSNEVADIIKHGVETDINNAHDRLVTVHKQVSDSIEVLRRLTAQLSSLNKRIDQSNNTVQQSLIMAAAAFVGGGLASILSLLF